MAREKLKNVRKKRMPSSMSLNIHSPSARGPDQLRAWETSLNISGRKAELREPRLSRIAVDASSEAAITWLRMVCTARISRLFCMNPSTHIWVPYITSLSPIFFGTVKNLSSEYGYIPPVNFFLHLEYGRNTRFFKAPVWRA